MCWVCECEIISRPLIGKKWVRWPGRIWRSLTTADSINRLLVNFLARQPPVQWKYTTLEDNFRDENIPKMKMISKIKMTPKMKMFSKFKTGPKRKTTSKRKTATRGRWPQTTPKVRTTPKWKLSHKWSQLAIMIINKYWHERAAFQRSSFGPSHSGGRLLAMT